MAVCKGIEAYEIFTKAIMTPWTERVEEVGKERRGGKEQEERNRRVKSACLLFCQK